MTSNESGRSMVEMIGVLAIIGMLSVGGIWGFSEAMERHKLNKATAQFSAVVNAVSAHMYDIHAESAEMINLIPYFKYKTPALFDDMPVLQMNSGPYEYLQDAMGNRIEIYFTNFYLRVVIAGGMAGRGSSPGFDASVAYCRNALSVLQQIYRENPKKFANINLDNRNNTFVYLPDKYDFANMSVGQITNVCYDTLLNYNNGTFHIWITFNNRKL